MSRYGIDYYDLAFYGPPQEYNFAAANFTATSVGIGHIGLTWNSPYGNWSKIKLTRNPFGFPIDPWDGTELDIKNNGTYFAYKETDPVSFEDTYNLTENAFYYYSLFIFKNEDNKWVRAGNASALSVGRYNYTDNLYSSIPSIYKVESLNDPLSQSDNPDLYALLSLFGFQLDWLHSYTNLLVSRYDTQKVYGYLIPLLMQEFGLPHYPEVGYQQERILIKNAAIFYKARGTLDGIKEYLKAFSGYGITNQTAAPNSPVEGITIGKNLMLDYNDSSFEEGRGHWVSSDSSATIKCLKERNITKLKLLSNVATLTIGQHSYSVGNNVYISGSSLPAFNSTVTPVTITSVLGDTISFSLTGTDVQETNAYNLTTGEYPIVYPDPACWNEPSAPTAYPNKQKGILAVKNANTGSGTVLLECGSNSPILKGIPVTAGDVYSFSIYSVSGGTARTITPSIDWYDRFGVFISTDTGTAASNSTGQFVVRLKAENKTAPTDAYYAVPTLSIASSAGSASNEWHYFDCAQFEESASATDFEEARQVKVILKANRINELANPHFNGTTSAPPWTVTGATEAIADYAIEPGATVYNANYLTLAAGIASLESIYSSDIVLGDTIYVSGVTGITNGAYTVTGWFPATTGQSSYVTFNTGGATTAPRTAVGGTFYKSSDSLELTSSGTSVTVDSWDGATTSQQMDIHYPLTDYTFSVYVKSDDNTDTATASISWYDSSNVFISTDTGTAVTITNSLTGGSWSRAYVTATAPSTAAYATVTVDFATQNGNTLLLDSALFENSPFALTFFSGSQGPADATSFLWEGTTDASRSHYYKNYAVITFELDSGLLKGEMPLGSTYALYFAQPGT